MTYTVLWLVWLAWFVVEEGVALATHGKGATLSAHVWHWFAITHTTHTPTPATRARRFALLAFLAWLVAHFLTGGYF